jgi:hypothetical protein
MNLKQRMFERIEKNSIKVNVNGEIIYLKNSMGWHVIYPPIDLDSIESSKDEYGNINWKKVKWDKTNFIFGGKANAIKYAVFGILVVALAIGVYEMVSSYNMTFENPLVKQCLKQVGIIIG